ncbi:MULTISPECIES: hypothetical protein [unclassified Acinetobacter]|uniref:hypothetical protein n=1 Tax=unclassified Acinetobacter TaxID=196816 RepID=UPI00190B2635|nr:MULTISPECIES: hypothetical protein [unclassified Acinetobacter]MBK0062371.1 hypothetical protein [Acinetobacter sp. S55]MBK0066175.1 hypothetical protein [Acinetobacter sp. S54]
MSNIALRVFWNNNPIPISEKFKNPDLLINVPFGAMISHPASGGSGSIYSVNGKTGTVVLDASDVHAEPIGSVASAKSALESEIETVRTLAQTNELKISTKTDQTDFEQAQQQIEQNRLALLTKADIQALALLSQLVDTKADQSYVNQQIANLVGSAPEALNTIYELAAAIQNEQSIIETLNQSVANRVRFDVATQALTEIQKENARTNIGAEKLGTAQQLVSQITAQSLGAATAAQGAKADTALQSADVAPVALSGLFSSLSGQSKIFDVVYSAYALGTNTAILATDTLGQMLGKLQAQITALSSGTSVNWVKANVVGTYPSSVTPSVKGYGATVSTDWEFAKINGMLWMRGGFTITANTLAILTFNPEYKVRAVGTGRLININAASNAFNAESPSTQTILSIYSNGAVLTTTDASTVGQRLEGTGSSNLGSGSWTCANGVLCLGILVSA